MLAGLTLYAAYLAGLALPLALVALLGSAQGAHGAAYEAGKGCALVGLSALFLQAVLAGRFKALERHFGQDRLLRFHRNMGILGLVLLTLHPLLLAAGGAGYTMLASLNLPWNIWAGKLALPMLAATVLMAVFRRKLGLSFERWRLGHDVGTPALAVLTLTHAMVTGSDFQQPDLLAAALAGGLTFCGCYAWHRLLRPRLLAQSPWLVTEVRQEAERVWTITLAPTSRAAKPMEHLPGQFHYLTLRRERGLPEEEHHFTISSSPTQRGVLTSTIKAVGDFTATIKDTQPGDAALVDGPYGRFSYLLHPEEKDLVFIAAGIGITPLRAMLRHMADTHADRRVLLIYQNRTEGDIVFRAELAAMAAGGARPALTVAHVLSRPGDGWKGEAGHIDRALLARFLGDRPEALAGKGYYLCGPEGFMEQVWRDLRAMGAPMRRVRWERFSLVD